jgi:hypothetical protein
MSVATVMGLALDEITPVKILTIFQGVTIFLFRSMLGSRRANRP